MFLIKPIALALMEAASFCGEVHHKRYSEQQELAPHKKTEPFLLKETVPFSINLKKEK